MEIYRVDLLTQGPYNCRTRMIWILNSPDVACHLC
jgi:hypothetical protein